MNWKIWHKYCLNIYIAQDATTKIRYLRSKEMKRLTATAIITLGIGLAGPTLAGPATWNTNSSTGVCSGGVGNLCTFTKDSYTLMARAYSTTDIYGNNAFEKATLTRYSGGLGVHSIGESWGSPQHALDDNGKDELIVFENSAPGYAYTGFEIGWRYNDSDISAWVGTLAGGYDFTGTKFSDLAGLGFTKFNFSNVPTNTTRSLGSTPNVGNYLILAPRADRNLEFVKISQISGQIPIPPASVSEPGILALFGIALIGFWANKRRKIIS